MKFFLFAVLLVAGVMAQEARDKRGVLLGSPLVGSTLVGAPGIIGARTIVGPGIIGARSVIAPGIIGASPLVASPGLIGSPLLSSSIHGSPLIW